MIYYYLLSFFKNIKVYLKSPRTKSRLKDRTQTNVGAYIYIYILYTHITTKKIK